MQFDLLRRPQHYRAGEVIRRRQQHIPTSAGAKMANSMQRRPSDPYLEVSVFKVVRWRGCLSVGGHSGGLSRADYSSILPLAERRGAVLCPASAWDRIPSAARRWLGRRRSPDLCLDVGECRSRGYKSERSEPGRTTSLPTLGFEPTKSNPYKANLKAMGHAGIFEVGPAGVAKFWAHDFNFATPIGHSGVAFNIFWHTFSYLATPECQIEVAFSLISICSGLVA